MLKYNGEEKESALFAKQHKGMSSHCGKIGHKSTDYFTLPRNKDKKEAYF